MIKLAGKLAKNDNLSKIVEVKVVDKNKKKKN